MWKWLALALGLATGGIAAASDLAVDGVAVTASTAGAPYEALSFGPLDDLKAKQEEKKKAKEEEQAARDAEAEAANAGKQARVVVLEWKGADTDYMNDLLQRNVKTRIARPDAKFYPSIDIYQAGRREPRRDVAPSAERASVPDENIGVVLNAVADIETTPWNAMSESDWGITANQLRGLAENELWFIDRPQLREPLFKLYVQIGRAAENQNNPVPPFYNNIGGEAVNYYWYLAGSLAHEDASLLGTLSDKDMYASIEYYKNLLDNGQIRPMKIAFELGDDWNAKQFGGEFTVFINGREVKIESSDSVYAAPPGRVDIYLKRSDGHSLSERINLEKLDDKVYFVRDTAQKVMGYDLVDQLMKHPNECTPELSGEKFNYLAIYAKLHMDSEIYVAIPQAGNPNKILLWRFDRKTYTLQKVSEDGASYPVRFAVLSTVGASFSGATLKPVDEAVEEEYQSCLDKVANGEALIDSCTKPEYAPELAPSGVPISFQLRGHYGRLMTMFGVEISPSITGEPWSDLYQTGDAELTDDLGQPILHEVPINRLLYTGVGVMLMKDAAIGLGPRGYVRFGWYNVPHMLDLTAHAGITAAPPGLEGKGRIRPLLDIDGFVGAMVPIEKTNRETAVPTFGLSAGAGVTF